jgi:hypothetical protein
MVSLKTHPEIEFLDNNSTEDLSLLLHATRPFYWRILLLYGFKHLYKKNRKTRKLESVHEKNSIL